MYILIFTSTWSCNISIVRTFIHKIRIWWQYQLCSLQDLGLYVHWVKSQNVISQERWACSGGSIRSSVSSVRSLSHLRLFETQRTAARQGSLSITSSWSPPKPMCIEAVMPSSHLILCRPLLLLPSIFPSIRVFSKESALHIRWLKYWNFSFNISPSNDHHMFLKKFPPIDI